MKMGIHFFLDSRLRGNDREESGMTRRGLEWQKGWFRTIRGLIKFYYSITQGIAKIFEESL